MADDTDTIEKTLGLGEHQRGMSRWLIYAVGLAIIGAALWFSLSLQGTERGVRYVSAEAKRVDFNVTVNATGTVEPTNLVEISSELSGTLDAVHVDFNDTVDVGTVLATLDTTQLTAQLAVSQAQLDAAAARVDMAQASLDEAREKYEVARNLEERGITPHQTFLTLQATFTRAQAEIKSALADKALAQANLELQQATLDKACICSPIRGIVLDRAADPGQIVASSFTAPMLFTVAEDLTEMELQVDIDEADIGRIAVGNRAVFTVDAYDDLSFPAEIAEVRFAPETIDGVVTYKAVLTIDNTELLLRPGMTATADITVAEVENALVVPNAALRYAPPRAPDEGDASDARSGLLGMLLPDAPEKQAQGSTRTLWVMRNGEPLEIEVAAGDSDGSVTEVIQGDLAEGDLVITDRIDG